MLRFSASESEITAMLRFIERRSQGGLWMLPLEAASRDDLRFRRTATPLLRRLRESAVPLAWGLLPLSDPDTAPASNPSFIRRTRDVGGTYSLRIDPDEAGLILLSLGPPQGTSRRREGTLATRDPITARASTVGAAAASQIHADGMPSSALRSALVEKCARRLRRRSERHESGRWYVAE